METTTCRHQEQIEVITRGIEHGTCTICGQMRRYDTSGEKPRRTNIRLGRINGVIVLPDAKETMELSIEEAAELESAAKEVPKTVVLTEPPKISEEEIAAARAANRTPEVAPDKLPEPKRRKRPQQDFEDNKEAILKDYRNLTLKKFFAKWRLSAVTWIRLKKLWKVEPKGHAEGRRKGIAPHAIKVVLKKVSGDRLPQFPDWAPGSWVSGEVAIQWLKTYEALNRMLLIRELARNQPASPAKMEIARGFKDLLKHAEKGLIDVENKEAQRVPAKKNWLAKLFKQ